MPMTLTCFNSFKVTLVSCSLIRSINTCCSLPLTIWEKTALSTDQICASALMTSTVAVRGSSNSRARSPK